MSIKTTQQDATAMASTQASLDEVLDDFDAMEPVEEPEIDPSIDLMLKVGVGKGRDHYHVMWFLGDGEIIAACPNHKLEVVPLEEAAKDGCLPFQVCEPVDWHVEPKRHQ